MTEQNPLVNQPTAAPSRKLKAGMGAGIGIAVTLVPVIFPAAMQVIETVNPVFAETWGPSIAAVVSALLAVLGGGSVSYVVRNRASNEQVKMAHEELTKTVINIIGKELK